jgi:mono/diheme cytochrome c family protein
LRSVAFGVRLSQSSSTTPNTTLGLLNAQGQMERLVEPSSTSTPPPSWQVLKSFEQLVPNQDAVEEEDEILRELKKKQSELAASEGGMETKVRSLLQQVVDLRMDYEMAANKRKEEREVIKKYTRTIERRKEVDVAWQKQLEQDMDAVCDICRDGEVTPDNQILFCEACNVAVHQMCYGIEEVPEGDYYCIACRYFNRGKASAGKQLKRIAPSPLPICCELCPAKQGAFIRSAHVSPEGGGGLSKWVHVVCAKWQGLDFEPLGQTDVVEDVSEIKVSFLRLGYKCILCLGRRGTYAKCRQEDCDSWMHITCARATGLCEVVHGENCHGPVDKNPWTLLCPVHSTVEPGAVRDRVSIDQLVRTAEEFPPEPIPEPLLDKVKPTKVFNKMSGRERHKFLADPEYEQNLLAELSRKLHGVHCEVCHQFEEDGKNLTRCGSCNVVFCASCVLPCDINCEPRDYKCPACLYVEEKENALEEFEQPQCHMCHQKGGWLRRAYANPVNRKSYWTHNPKEYAKTLFAKDLWCHALCTMYDRLLSTYLSSRLLPKLISSLLCSH